MTDRTQGETPDVFLVVVGADGSVDIDREVSAAHEAVTLVAATPAQAILARSPTDSLGRVTGPARIVANDITTGRERLIVEGDRPHELCQLEMIDLAGGHRRPDRLPMRCSEVLAVRASPSGDLAAVVYGVIAEAPDWMPELRPAIVDLVGSRIRSERLIGNDLICDNPTECPGVRPVHYLGLAWDDDATVRIALVDLAADPDFNPEGEPVPQEALIIDRHPVR